jgi:hypothetical protein
MEKRQRQANDQQWKGNIKAHVEGIGTVRNDTLCVLALTSSVASQPFIFSSRDNRLAVLDFHTAVVCLATTGTGTGTFHAVIVIVIVILAIEQNGRAARRQHEGCSRRHHPSC